MHVPTHRSGNEASHHQPRDALGFSSDTFFFYRTQRVLTNHRGLTLLGMVFMWNIIV